MSVCLYACGAKKNLCCDVITTQRVKSRSVAFPSSSGGFNPGFAFLSLFFFRSSPGNLAAGEAIQIVEVLL